MRQSFIQKPSGEIHAYNTSDKNESEHPPPHSLDTNDVGVFLIDEELELSDEPSDHETFHARIHECEYKNGKLHRKGKPLKAQCVEKLRMKDGALEDNTIHGWRRRAIFEPEVDDDGEEVEGPDGMPEGEWYAMGPRGKDGKPNLIPIGKPDPEDRQVWKGTQGNEIEPEERVIPNMGGAEPNKGNL